MKIEQQVCSLEYAQRLRELGVKQLSLWYWWQYDKDSFDLKISVNPTSSNHYISAFTVAELGRFIPTKLIINEEYFWLNISTEYQPFYVSDHDIYREKEIFPCDDDNLSEADYRAIMLIYLIENNHIRARDL